MPSKELIEKVARALAESDNNVWGDMGPRMPDAYRENAKAAISTILAALLEPTEGMLDDAWRLTSVRNASTWKVMLAASALGEQSE